MNKLKIKNSGFYHSRLKIKNSRFKIFQSPIRNPHSAMGLTLIELMVVAAILALISSTIFTVFQGSLLSQRRGTNRALVYSEARAALDMMSREIEQAMVDERIGAHYQLFDGPSGYRRNSIGDEFYFVVPMDNSGTTDLCKVGYWLCDYDNSDTILRRYFIATDSIDSYDTYENRPESGNGGTGDYWEHSNTNSGANALIGNVSNLQFQYWDENTSQFEDPNSSTSGYALPRAVKITLVMEYPMEKDRTDTAIFTTVVDIPGSGQ